MLQGILAWGFVGCKGEGRGSHSVMGWWARRSGQSTGSSEEKVRQKPGRVHSMASADFSPVHCTCLWRSRTSPTPDDGEPTTVREGAWHPMTWAKLGTRYKVLCVIIAHIARSLHVRDTSVWLFFWCCRMHQVIWPFFLCCRGAITSISGDLRPGPAVKG